MAGGCPLNFWEKSVDSALLPLSHPLKLQYVRFFLDQVFFYISLRK